MKRLLSILLVCALFVGMLPAGSAAFEAKEIDLKGSSEYFAKLEVTNIVKTNEGLTVTITPTGTVGDTYSYHIGELSIIQDSVDFGENFDYTDVEGEYKKARTVSGALEFHIPKADYETDGIAIGFAVATNGAVKVTLYTFALDKNGDWTDIPGEATVTITTPDEDGKSFKEWPTIEATVAAADGFDVSEVKYQVTHKNGATTEYLTDAKSGWTATETWIDLSTTVNGNTTSSPLTIAGGATAALTDGETITVAVRSKDSQGYNTETRTFVVDTTAPSVTAPAAGSSVQVRDSLDSEIELVLSEPLYSVGGTPADAPGTELANNTTVTLTGNTHYTLTYGESATAANDGIQSAKYVASVPKNGDTPAQPAKLVLTTDNTKVDGTNGEYTLTIVAGAFEDLAGNKSADPAGGPYTLKFTPNDGTPIPLTWNNTDADAGQVTITFGDDTSKLPAYTVSVDSAAVSAVDGTVSYEVDDDSVVEIDPDTGAITSIKKAGSATITASVTAKTGADEVVDPVTSLPFVDGEASFTIKVEAADPIITISNLKQTVGSVSELNAALAPNDGLTIVVEYQVPEYTVNASSCGVPEHAANALAHTEDCALLQCGCGATVAVEPTVRHTEECAYNQDPTAGTCDCAASGNTAAHTVACPIAACDCGANDSVAYTDVHESTCQYGKTGGDAALDCDCNIRQKLTLASQHTENCGAVTKTDAWKAWGATIAGSDGSTTVENYIKALDEAEILVRAYTSGTSSNVHSITQYAGVDVSTGNTVTEADNKLLKMVIAKESAPSGGGGGSTSYKVTFNVGENGKITKGSATAYVNSGAKLAADKVPVITANEGYKFLGWSLDGKTVADPTADKVTKAVTYSALYEKTGEVTPSAEGFVKDRTAAYMNGYPDGTFRPQAGITRGEVAAVVARTILPEFPADKAYTPSYSDLGGHWAAKYIGYLEDLGVVTGYPDGTYKADQTITRAEFVAIVIRVDGLVNGTNAFADVSDSNWASKYIVSAVEKQYVNGYPDGTFRPEQAITRAETAKIVNAVLGWADKEAVGEMKFSDVPQGNWAYDHILKASNGVEAE